MKKMIVAVTALAAITSVSILAFLTISDMD